MGVGLIKVTAKLNEVMNWALKYIGLLPNALGVYLNAFFIPDVSYSNIIENLMSWLKKCKFFSYFGIFKPKFCQNGKICNFWICNYQHTLSLVLETIKPPINKRNQIRLYPLTANDEISHRVIKTPRLPTTRYFVAFSMSQNCQRHDISLTLRQNGTRQHRSSKATGDRKCLTIHVTHSFLISIKTNTLFFDMIIYFKVVNYE